MSDIDIQTEDIGDHLLSRRPDMLAKRLLDICGSILALTLLAPLLAIVAIIIKADSRGPVLFRQPRIGRNGVVFDMIKFRSMMVHQTPPIPAPGARAAGDVVKLRDDPRVTPVGRWIRRYSIDELPQLLNVLGGTMSLVGPRPLPLAMATPYPVFVQVRSLVRPGITGLFQLRDRDKGQNARFMIEADLEYLTQFSFCLDLRIILATPWAVVSARGAY